MSAIGFGSLRTRLPVLTVHIRSKSTAIPFPTPPMLHPSIIQAVAFLLLSILAGTCHANTRQANCSSVFIDNSALVHRAVDDHMHPHQPMAVRACGSCNYGALPGMWHLDGRSAAGLKWETFTEGCALRNMLAVHASETTCRAQPPSEQHRAVLLIGDSVDRELVMALDRAYNFTLWFCGESTLHLVRMPCGTVIGTVHVYASSVDGPFYLGHQENYRVILHREAQIWRQTIRQAEPSLVVINSNLWDISRAFALSQLNISQDFNRPNLPKSWVDSWTANTTAMVTYVRRLFPISVVGIHTAVPARIHPNGTAEHIILGQRSFLIQLNAAARALAAKMGMPLFDYEAMVAGFHDYTYLLDRHHPSPDVSLEMANLYLNYAAQCHSHAGREIGAHLTPWTQP